MIYFLRVKSDVILGGMGKKSPTHNIVGRADKRGVLGRALTAAPEGQSKKAEASECSRSRFGNYGELSEVQFHGVLVPEPEKR
ncbi:hypothetical protein OAF13_02925 [Akkermansiaceae bacterium]|nr:hypothetical protein [Akkermansiaceae bacterium]